MYEMDDRLTALEHASLVAKIALDVTLFGVTLIVMSIKSVKEAKEISSMLESIKHHEWAETKLDR